MVVQRFNPPTRDQLSLMARGDNRLVRALEQLFATAGQDLADIQDQITALEIRVTVNEGDIIALDLRVTTNEADIAALEIRMTAAELAIAANTARIKTNEVLLWLSM